MAAKIYVGTCSWSEKTLIGSFYPNDIKQPEMIEFYARHFPVVEVDSTFYHMPSEASARSWAKRTPPNFKFNYKAFGPMTTHPADFDGEKHRRGTEQMFLEFDSAIAPLAAENRLGYVLFQFPKWFFPSHANKDYIAWCVEQMPNSLIAVEFRNGYWFKDEEHTRRTCEFLSGIGAAYVNVDEPQVDINNSCPPINLITTSDLSVFRLHGRNTEKWDVMRAPVGEKFDYQYTDEDLSDIAPRIEEIALQPVKEIHVMFNNVHHGYGPRDASRLIALLRQIQLPIVEPTLE